MNRLKGLFLFIFILTSSIAISQQITLKADSQPLNEVLINLASTYNFQISFDDRSLSEYTVSANGMFKTPEEAVGKLISGLPFELSRDGDVLVITNKKKTEKPRTFSLTGQILEKGTMEPLPYSNVIVNGYGMATDLKGSFSYLSSTDSVFELKASHLGYYILDTTVSASTDLHFQLTPSVVGLSEVVIKYSKVDRSTLIGDRPGVMKLNHQVANFLPGYGDNSVFNLLRLQPGILASGEETNDLIIWGCYEGQSKILFDGFTIFGLRNFNDNISAFNPLMAKDLEVYKGGYDVRYGERVGGIVNITGKNGNTERPSFTVDLNNMTLNGMVEIPMFKTGSLIIAVRHTYYELYNPSDINSLLKRNNSNGTSDSSAVDVNIVPDYRFRDINIKYSAKIHDRNLFYVSLYGANDRFSYSVDQLVKKVTLIKNTHEYNTQAGGSVFYGQVWKNGYSTNFSFGFSSLTTDYADNMTVDRPNGTQTERTDLTATNTVKESTLKVDNRFPVSPRHTLQGGLIFYNNQIELHEDTFGIVQSSISGEASRIVLYFQDIYSIGKVAELKAGLRLTHAVNLEKLYPEPRVSLSIKAGESFRINAAWGLYNQYITKSSVVDDQGNYRYIWTVCDNIDIPVLKAIHYVLGASYYHNDFTVSLEGYYKPVQGLTRYIRNNALGIEGIYDGIGRSYGIDVMIKKDYKGHSAWISYSLGKTEELFEYFIKDEYRRAPQDQRHEIKAAVLINLNPFYISADYVFGSGFPSAPNLLSNNQDNLTYSRLDASFIYKFLDRKLKGEAGLSVLNVLNTQNIKYANYERIAANQTNTINIYSEAIPLTPTLYLKISM